MYAEDKIRIQKKRRNSRSDALKSRINPSYKVRLHRYQLEDQLLTKVRRRLSNILRMLMSMEALLLLMYRFRLSYHISEQIR